MAEKKKRGKVRFIRKKGRIIPIRSGGGSRPRKRKSLTPSQRGARKGAAVGTVSAAALGFAAKALTKPGKTAIKSAFAAGVGGFASGAAIGSLIGALKKRKKRGKKKR